MSLEELDKREEKMNLTVTIFLCMLIGVSLAQFSFSGNSWDASDFALSPKNEERGIIRRRALHVQRRGPFVPGELESNRKCEHMSKKKKKLVLDMARVSTERKKLELNKSVRFLQRMIDSVTCDDDSVDAEVFGKF